jgi:hypothetical protein
MLTLTVYVVNIVMCLYMANYLSLVNWWTKVRGNDDIRAYNGGKKGLRVISGVSQGRRPGSIPQSGVKKKKKKKLAIVKKKKKRV